MGPIPRGLDSFTRRQLKCLLPLMEEAAWKEEEGSWNSGVGRPARVDANFLYPPPLLQPPTLQEDSSKRLFFSPIGRNGSSGCQRGRPGPSLDPWGDQAQFSSTIPSWWLLSSPIPCYHAQHQLMWDLFLFPSYSQLIAECPVAVLLLCLAFILLCTLAGLLGGQLPDFSKPILVRGHREGWGPHAWPPQIGLGQNFGVALLGVDSPVRAQKGYRGDPHVQPYRQAGQASLLQGPKGAELRRKNSPSF